MRSLYGGNSLFVVNCDSSICLLIFSILALIVGTKVIPKSKSKIPNIIILL
jgi:hypothetical protein